MSDAIYFKSPTDQASFVVKLNESVRFSTRFNHLPDLLLYFYCLYARVSTKGQMFLECVQETLALAVALHEYFLSG